jgi:hypothetical protein
MAEPSTPLGIPKAEFIEDMAGAALTMEAVQKLFQEEQEILTKCKLFEKSLRSGLPL